MADEKTEKEVFEENLKEAVEEAKKPEPTGRIHGWAGIIIGIIGLFIPVFFSVFTGMTAAILGVFANKHGKKVLGIICGILAIINMLYFLILMGTGNFM